MSGQDSHNLVLYPASVATRVPCFQCGYDLRGLPVDQACPECGESTALTLQLLEIQFKSDLKEFMRYLNWFGYSAILLLPTCLLSLITFFPATLALLVDNAGARLAKKGIPPRWYWITAGAGIGLSLTLGNPVCICLFIVHFCHITNQRIFAICRELNLESLRRRLLMCEGYCWFCIVLAYVFVVYGLSPQSFDDLVQPLGFSMSNVLLMLTRIAFFMAPLFLLLQGLSAVALASRFRKVLIT